MSDLVQYGGYLGIIIVAVVLLVKTFLPWLKSDNQQANQSNRDWTVQRDIEKTLSEIRISMLSQASAQDRMAYSLSAIAEDINSLKTGIQNLPKDIASAIKHRGNGHG